MMSFHGLMRGLPNTLAPYSRDLYAAEYHFHNFLLKVTFIYNYFLYVSIQCELFRAEP